MIRSKFYSGFSGQCEDQINKIPQCKLLHQVNAVGRLASWDQCRLHEPLRRGGKAMPTLLGIPLDANSSYLRGAAGAPENIREAMRCDASNQWTELGVDLGAAGAFTDAGDLRL